MDRGLWEVCLSPPVPVLGLAVHTVGSLVPEFLQRFIFNPKVLSSTPGNLFLSCQFIYCPQKYIPPCPDHCGQLVGCHSVSKGSLV